VSLLAKILAAVRTDEACTAGDENSNENDLLLVVVGSLFVSGFEAHDAKLRRPRAGSGEDERIVSVLLAVVLGDLLDVFCRRWLAEDGDSSTGTTTGDLGPKQTRRPAFRCIHHRRQLISALRPKAA